MTAHEKTDVLLAYLAANHRSKVDAISSKELEDALGLSNREIRRLINRLRSDACPICSDSGGYYYSDSFREVDMTIAHLKRQIESMSNAINGLLKASGALEAMELVTIEVRVTL